MSFVEGVTEEVDLSKSGRRYGEVSRNMRNSIEPLIFSESPKGIVQTNYKMTP